jgi:ribosomal-protein-alanine N-acetyltransferase
MSLRQRSDRRVLEVAGRELVVGSLSSSDTTRVMEIERSSYAAPWSVAMFTVEMGKRHSQCLGAWEAEALRGFLICSRFYDVWHLLNVAVDPTSRRTKVGATLVSELLRRLDEQAILSGGTVAPVTLEVRASNTAAQELYSRFGFMAAGVRHGYYPDNGEDAVLMWRTPATLRGSLDDVPGVQT